MLRVFMTLVAWRAKAATTMEVLGVVIVCVTLPAGRNNLTGHILMSC